MLVACYKADIIMWFTSEQVISFSIKAASDYYHIMYMIVYTEFELSAQDQITEPPDALYDSIMLTTTSYVPLIIGEA